jgi:hypothetical protein
MISRVSQNSVADHPFGLLAVRSNLIVPSSAIVAPPMHFGKGVTGCAMVQAISPNVAASMNSRIITSQLDVSATRSA